MKKRGIVSLLLALGMALAMLSAAVAAGGMLPRSHDCKRSHCRFRKGILQNLDTYVEGGHLTPTDKQRIRAAIYAGQIHDVSATGTGANIGVLRSGMLHAKRDTMKSGGEPAREIAGFYFLKVCDNLWKPDKPGTPPVVQHPSAPAPSGAIAVARVRYSSGGTTSEASATAIASGQGSAAAATSQVTNVTNNNYYGDQQTKKQPKQDEPASKTPIRDVEGAGIVRYGTSGAVAVQWEDHREVVTERQAPPPGPAPNPYKAGVGPAPRTTIDSTPGVKTPVYTSVAVGPINQGPHAPAPVVGTTSGGNAIGYSPGIVAPKGTDSTIGTGPSPR